MKFTTLSLSDGWHRMPDKTGQFNSFQIQGEPHYWHWAFVKNGQPCAIGQCRDQETTFNTDDKPNQAMMVLAEIWRRESGLSVFDQMRRGIEMPCCKYNGVMLEAEIRHEGLGAEIRFDAHTNIYEEKIVSEVVEDLKSLLRRRLREFPICGFGGAIHVFGKINRPTKSVQAGYYCTCGC